MVLSTKSKSRTISQPFHVALFLTSLGMAALTVLQYSSCSALFYICLVLAVALAWLTILPSSEDRDLTDIINRIYVGLLLMTIVCALIPLSVYGFARFTGRLASEREWLALDAPHGPLQHDEMEIALFLPTVLLGILSVFVTLPTALYFLCVQQGKMRTLLRSTALGALQWGLLILIGSLTFWAID